ncbi:MAG: alpha/beta hydrolase [Myxococcales bacterium]|nr:alpha/beta hydrolase [Myxococcales bacterium]
MSTAPVTERLEIDGLEIEACWVGPPRDGGPDLVFLHEGLGSITQWHETPEQIATASGRPALVFARQGYGHSTPTSVPRPLHYMHDEAARLPAILAAAGITDPILIGHSDGASIAIIAAGEHRVAPRALVLIAPHVFVEDAALPSIAAAAAAYRTGNLRAKLARHHADVDGAFWGWNRAWLDPAFRAWNLEALLPEITAPTLILQGEDDEYGTTAQVFAIQRGLAGPVEIELVHGAGHAPFRDAPTPVHTRIAAFVRAHLG